MIRLCPCKSHQPYIDNVDPKQDYNPEKCQSSCFNDVPKKKKKKVNIKGLFFFKRGNKCQLSPLNTCENDRKSKRLDDSRSRAKLQK